ncbi:MAG: Glycosyl transferase family 2 [Candidatus Gottesmanbacteria bacterium GW2011_GWB1_43_11]|uniref:Glycosyl transferase family 2 n=1 Tax=Candidatus Gottesmanbacteria bacterium GW2011_GWB1_43_11 TaxID=1618446 RepID=A0A0G1FKK9_9BACT|nr:MAG: Glycosyl transferase family 2 [Candidatus Gottesmanbacteria bacterium GW2011_GWA2_42_16]KKS82564.1 MAG: Glycosyl transferase family 2 [Candidatus Gottesmanbacteria bacterium GW2011_GWC1_43_10]KKS87433.1 MAG: Glycosyl transferase family 2 [Candidatus Gottesmanbacteria bacterium GW2011_GWB1_43_11]OGG10192.1 MAG: hypothetical protein A2699_01435 [Candidatus Gottesmanbacteria bacterium RIFCSPHIGHO2_01_FULL_43_15]HCM37602.1 hypothetical protein [Patescibacteria group bacterium]
MKLSVVLATYNEEKNLPACLESVAGWCSEIVVIDGSSRDHTIDIAQKFGARVTVTDNPPIFHINKQKAIDLARGEWILQLDADERVSRELKTEIDAAIKNPDIDGYWLPRKNYFLGRFLTKGGQYPDYTLRLYRKGKGRLPLKDVHEQAIVLGEVGYLKNPLIHMADPSFQRYIMRYKRYVDLLAQQISVQEKRINIFPLVNYLLIKPVYWFLLIYVRHKGFVDSWQGFVFAVFSGLRYPLAYIKYLTNYARRDH